MGSVRTWALTDEPRVSGPLRRQLRLCDELLLLRLLLLLYILLRILELTDVLLEPLDCEVSEVRAADASEDEGH